MAAKLTPEQRVVAKARVKAYMKVWHQTHKASVQANKKAYRERRRAMVFTLLGGRCAHCPESDPVVLAIDHVNDDGALERKNEAALYNRILSGKHDGRYQLLCCNCNWRKELRRRHLAYELRWNNGKPSRSRK